VIRPFLAGLYLAAVLAGSSKIAVTVIEQKSGTVVTGLKTEDFTVTDDRVNRAVENVEYGSGPLDVMLLVDTSLVGETVQAAAANLIAQLEAKEQMAIVSFHSSADLIQDFTSSKELLNRALAGVKYGNTPRVLDALYAAIDGGFQSSNFRRVILLATAGFEGPSRVTERDVIRLARRNGVSIFPVYVAGHERGLFETLARQTGGASFNLRDMHRASKEPPGQRIFSVLRSFYTLTVQGNLTLGEKLKVEVRRPEKLLVSALPLE
jgi:VWFA-related protein